MCSSKHDIIHIKKAYRKVIMIFHPDKVIDIKQKTLYNKITKLAVRYKNDNNLEGLLYILKYRKRFINGEDI